MLNEQQENDSVKLAGDTAAENKIDKPNISLDLADMDGIQRRCPFVSEAIDNLDIMTKIEWNTLEAIVRDTYDGDKLVQEVKGMFPEILRDMVEAPSLDEDEIPRTITCAWVKKITSGRECNACELCGVIKKPNDLGFKPWNTKKRIMLLLCNLDEELQVAEAVLQYHSDIYFQGERLVRIVPNRLKAVSGSRNYPLEVQSITAANLQEILCGEFVFLKINADSVTVTYPPTPIVKGLLERAKFPSLRHIRGLTQVPVIRQDGTVLQDPGWDAKTELLYQPQHEFPRVPDFPTQDEVKAALDLLLDVVSDFPFENDFGRAVYLSTVLTVVGRFAFQGCVPMVLIDANTPGVGKTKLADTIGIITTGQPLPRATQMEKNWEERKQITSILLKGERLLLIDNIGSRFGNPVLDALLTSEIWQDRLNNTSVQVTLPNLLQVIATGNNLQLKADTVRRCLRLQLHTSVEHPEARTEFYHPDLEAWVAQQQPHLLIAALTLLRAFVVAGKPKQDLVTLGSFAGWSELVQAAVKWAYHVDPGEARVKAEDEMDLDKEILEKLIRGWSRLVPQGAAISCRRLMEAAAKSGEAGIDIFEAMEMSGSGKRTAVALGFLITKFRKRVHQGRYFDHGSKEKTSEGRLWKLFGQQ